MTHATSHVFSNDKTSSQPGEYIRVVITPRKISVSERAIVSTSTPGRLKEVVLHRYYYELKRNSGGEKYLTISMQQEDGTVQNVSMDLWRKGLAWPNSLNREVVLEDAALVSELINETLCQWFGYSSHCDLDTFAGTILFPALNGVLATEDELHGRKRMAGLHQVLVTLSDALPDERVLKALHNNDSWESFVEDICYKGTVTNDEERYIVSKCPALLPLATMKLGITITEMEKLGQAPYDFLNTFLASEIDAGYVRFMLNHLPELNRVEATLLLFDISTRHTGLRQSGKTIGRFEPSARWYSTKATLPERKVPTALRPALAQALLTRLREGVEPQITDIEEGRAGSLINVQTGLCDTFTLWFAESVVEPSLVSDVKIQDITDRIVELFGSSLLPEGTLPLFHSKEGVFFTNVTDFPQIKVDVVKMLERFRKKPDDCSINSYINRWGELSLIGKEIYSFDSLMKLIERSAKTIDKSLKKLERDITPANRAAYLTFAHRERDQKKTWYYYDLGVTDPSKIIAMKMCKVKDESEIRMYAALPDELFYELIGLQNQKAVEDSAYFGSVQSYNTEAKRYSPPIRGIDEYRRLISDIEE